MCVCVSVCMSTSLYLKIISVFHICKKNNPYIKVPGLECVCAYLYSKISLNNGHIWFSFLFGKVYNHSWGGYPTLPREITPKKK